MIQGQEDAMPQTPYRLKLRDRLRVLVTGKLSAPEVGIHFGKLKDGRVVITFDRPTQQVTMRQASAIQFARKLRRIAKVEGK